MRHTSNEVHFAPLQRPLKHSISCAQKHRLTSQARIESDMISQLEASALHNLRSVVRVSLFCCDDPLSMALLHLLITPLSFANTLALIPFPQWIGPSMV